MRNLILIFGIVLSFSAYAQHTLYGKISSKGGEALAYASVGFMGTTMGTVSNASGMFCLHYQALDLSNTDSLRISMMGYESITMAADSLLLNSGVLDIKLHEKINAISEVLILAGEMKSKTLGTWNTSLLNMSCNMAMDEFPDNNLGSEIGKRFYIPKGKNILDSLAFKILYNTYDTIRLRINVYALAKNLPGELLNKQNILVELINRKTGWVVVNLAEYRIITNNDVIASVEWVYKSQRGKHLALPICMPTHQVHYYKYGSQNNWMFFRSMTTAMKLYIRHSN